MEYERIQMCRWNAHIIADTLDLFSLETVSGFPPIFCQKLLAVRNWSCLSHV